MCYHISMNEEILCSVCGKEISNQKILMCADCKVAIKVEYEGIKKQSKNQQDKELREFKKYSFFGL